MHDAIQSRRACLADEDISRYFRGVFGANELDLNGLVKDTQSNWTIILNTEPISFDDWMNQIYKSNNMIDVLTKMLHHLNLLAFITQQALYPRLINATALQSQASGFFSFIFRQNTTHCVNGSINFLQINKM